MKRNVMGTGTNACILCGDKFSLVFDTFSIFGAKCLVCFDCRKSVCQKCGIETLSSSKNENIWLCKICAETREMWKKSNAWFFKGLPKYTIPKKQQPAKLAFNRRPIENLKTPQWSLNIASANKTDDNSSSDEEDMARLAKYRNRTDTVTKPEESSTEEEEDDLNEQSGPEKSPSEKSVDIFTAISEFTSIANISDTEQPILVPLRRISIGGGVQADKTEPSKNNNSPTESETDSPLPLSSPITSKHSPLNQINDSKPICNGTFNNKLNNATPTKVFEKREDYSSLGIEASRGSVELTITYDSTNCSLHVLLHRAKDLNAMDIHGTSDPFCKLNLVPLSKTSHRLRTKTISKSIHPEFNEKLTFYGVSETDLSHQSLHILVLDDDKYGYSFLGEARFPLNRLRPHISRDLCLNLCKHYSIAREDEVWGIDECCQNGQILLTLCFSTKKRALVVNIIKCINLIPMDNNGFSDPFIKLYLKPDLHKRKYKTNIKWKTLNPIFNEEFLIETRITELTKQTLVITVWDKDIGKCSDYLGCLELCCKSKGDRLRQWIDMIKYPDHKHEAIHNLSNQAIDS